MKNFKKLMTVLLSLVLTISSVSYVYASDKETSDGDVKKEETVYAFLDANGNFKSATVSEWLHSDNGFKDVEDESILSDIKNLKGDEEIIKDGNTLTWNSDNSDIYYQGTSDKKLPLSMQITYYFDGQKVNIEDVVGQSGKLEIRIKLINNEEKTEVISGKTRHISTLFPCVIITDLKTDIFENVDADGAIVVNESKNQVVSFVTVSGASKLLNDSSITELNDIKDKLKDEFVIKANVTNLEMPSIYCAVSGMMDLDNDNITASDLDELKNGINDLQSAMNEILDGSNSLSSGASELKSGANSLNSGASDLSNGITQVQTGLNTLVANNDSLTAGSSQIQTGLKQIQDQINGYSGKISELTQGSTQFKNALSYDAYKAALKNSEQSVDIDALVTANQTIIEELTAAVSQMEDGDTKTQYTKIITALTYSNAAMTSAPNNYLAGLNNSYTAIDSGIQLVGGMMSNSATAEAAKENPTLKDGIDQLVDGSTSLATGISSYTAGVNSVKEGVDKLAGGATTLVEGSKKIADGSASLSDGANELNSGLNKFNSEGISELSTKVNDAIGTLDDVVDVVNEVLDQSVEYNNYAGASSSMDTSVKFIMKTEEVSAPEETKETIVETKEESTTLWQRIKNLFK